MSDAQREGTQGKGATRNADAADASRPSTNSSLTESRASSSGSREEPRASTAEPLGLEDVSFEQDEEGPPLHPEVGFESDTGADGDMPLTPKPITAQVVGRTDVGLV